MLFKQESIEPINFEGLLIHDFTAGHSTSASFAVIEVPSGVEHCEAWSKRSDKYYYIVSGCLWFMIDGVEHFLSTGCLCLVSQGQRFAYSNRSSESVHLILVHVPSFDLESEVFID
ncbi:cupin domain-containing protein [Nostoc sp. CHAB 5784]|uniref:cupin domain-containing protein n=1 Tax=Nostoc mirabile TaxID=2907820 RepID=UPI001E65C6C3|nr:cupin domain-containing protein [Nostoc mirabile]MCC5670063.1 cupin domain-containing protein [Nostoc mirabile CHAB5784]